MKHQRLSSQMMNKALVRSRRRQQVMMTILLMMFGIILMTHIQSVNANSSQMEIADRYKARQEELKHYVQQNEKLMQENARLNKLKEQAMAYLLSEENAHLLDEINKVKLIAGFTEVFGNGLELTLMDKPDYDILKDPLDSIVHDADVRYAVELLKGNGADAISINGFRIVNSTYILCIGPTILVNQERLVPPYVISAIGDGPRMLAAVNEDPYFAIRRQQPTGIVVASRQVEAITLPSFTEVDQIEDYISLLEVSDK